MKKIAPTLEWFVSAFGDSESTGPMSQQQAEKELRALLAVARAADGFVNGTKDGQHLVRSLARLSWVSGKGDKP